MKLSLCLCAALLVAAVAGAPTAGDHDAARTAYVAEINAMPGILWQARVNSKFKVGVQLHGGIPLVPPLACGPVMERFPSPIATPLPAVPHLINVNRPNMPSPNTIPSPPAPPPPP